MSDKPSEALSRAAHRAGQQSFFLASVFQSYQRSNDISDAVLAEMLDCTEHDLPRLALCRRPVARTATFVADIEHLAMRFQINAEQLAAIIRQVDALEALRGHLAVREQPFGMLRAARDRDQPEDSDEEQRHE